MSTPLMDVESPLPPPTTSAPVTTVDIGSPPPPPTTSAPVSTVDVGSPLPPHTMDSAPLTTSNDLWRMGLSPDILRTVLERVSGKSQPGDLKGFWFPTDGERATNYVKSDWTLVETKPAEIVSETKYHQKYTNFEGNQPVTFNFDHSVSVTTGSDYTQTKNWDVSVNAGLPIGTSGAMLGFNAGMSASEVKSKSYSKTVAHAVSFGVEVPPGEGRIVTETTTTTRVPKVYRASIGVRGAVGVIIDPGFWYPNVYWKFHNIEVIPDLFYLVATSEITLASIDTAVDTEIKKIDLKGEAFDFVGHTGYGTVGSDGLTVLSIESLEDMSVSEEPDTVSDDSRLKPNENLGMTISRPGTPNPDVIPASFTGNVHVTIDGFDGKPTIPARDRPRKVQQMNQQFILDVMTSSPPNAVANIQGVLWDPAKSVCRYTIRYDPAKITRITLLDKYVHTSRKISWGGAHMIHFG
ncbi:hypothetical protein BT96DRAFT_1096989 [Gymnopus androsaceus JB14]|uniref:Uncharacterized protein n=1 Tax=Gymnopus androsaceus JB14 TaxID=1447944 RepID=A0A6A4HRC7_9AGAR|nr:hypothetical protein BT96DRAFT_1096989 [Gymnopus androsaceus JB14]